MKTMKDLVEFMKTNSAQWQAEIDSYPEAKAKRQGAVECIGILLGFIEDTTSDSDSDSDGN